MNIQTRNHGENQVVISTEDFQKLVEIAQKVEPIEITEALSEEEIERREREFEQKMFEEGFFANIATRDETDEEFDSYELLEIEGEPLSETIIRERR